MFPLISILLSLMEKRFSSIILHIREIQDDIYNETITQELGILRHMNQPIDRNLSVTCILNIPKKYVPFPCYNLLFYLFSILCLIYTSVPVAKGGGTAI